MLKCVYIALKLVNFAFSKNDGVKKLEEIHNSEIMSADKCTRENRIIGKW
jgi:hypothetical protein